MTDSRIRIVSVIHARTTNDVNGNPRRCYLGIAAQGRIVRIDDEGYSGRPEWVRKLSDRGVWDVSVTVTPGQYRDYVRMSRTLGV